MSALAGVNAMNEKLLKLEAHLIEVRDNLRRHKKATAAAGKAAGPRRARRANYDPARDGLPPWVYASLMQMAGGLGTGSDPATSPAQEHEGGG